MTPEECKAILQRAREAIAEAEHTIEQRRCVVAERDARNPYWRQLVDAKSSNCPFPLDDGVVRKIWW